MNLKKITNWSNFPIVNRNVFSPSSKLELIECFPKVNTCIARGNGRCYGDSAYSQVVVSTLNLNRILFFDEKNELIRCESGVTLEDLLNFLVPKGFFLPVTPGTKFITVGGAVASDIHGKNHHLDGSFSNFIILLEILDSFGNLIQLKPEDDLFLQSIGGMGLTGIITEVEFKLKKIETSFINSTKLKAANLKQVIDLMIENKHATYSVAWIDCLSKNDELGRSILILGEHVTEEELKHSAYSKNIFKLHNTAKIRLPFFFPTFVLSSFTIKIFNQLFYLINSRKGNEIVHYDSFFYPLDSIKDWNKIYGKKGFIEYQFVVPFENAYEGIKEILEIIVDNKLASFLCVIKLFGNNTSNRYLNFPIEGITLGMDLKMSKDIWNILDQLDEIVNKYKGKVYLTKDSRMKSDNFKKQYPDMLLKNDKFQSDQSLRLNQLNLNTYLIIGANSDIAKAYVKYVSNQEKDAYFILCSQNINSLKLYIGDINISDRAEVIYLNLLNDDSFHDFVLKLNSKPRVVLYAAGICPENDVVFGDNDLFDRMIAVNYSSAVKLINVLVREYNPFLQKIVGISSIAGLRGRKSNFLYGSSKAAFHQYLFGLRQKTDDFSVIVQSVTPGAVRTKMTADLKLPFFASTPERIAEKIYKTKFRFQIYPNLLWRIIAIIVKISPAKIVSKLQ